MGGDVESGRRGEHFGALLSTVFLLQFLVALDMSLVNIALPAIRVDLGFSEAGLQWVVTAYLLTFAGLMLLGGRLGDLWGRRVVVITGIGAFAVASAVGGLAQSAGVLIAARAVQGVAGALLAPAALALVTTVADPDHRKKAMALWGGAGAVGGAVGVVLSGVLTDWISWRAVMFVNLPITLLALIAALASVPAGRERASGSLDVPGAILVTGGVAALVYAVSEAGDRGWGSAQTLVGFAIAVVALIAFGIVEVRTKHPLMPPALMRRRTIVGANVFGFMLAAGQLASFYFASLYVQTVWDVEPDIAGLLFLPFSFCVVVGVMGSARVAARFGVRATISGFGLLSAIGLALFGQMPADYNFWLGILLPSAVTAIGIGGAMVLVGNIATAGVAPKDVGVASAVTNSARQLGGTIGLAVLVTLAGHVSGLRDGYLAGFTGGAVFLLVGSILAWFILPGARDDAAVEDSGELPGLGESGLGEVAESA